MSDEGFAGSGESGGELAGIWMTLEPTMGQRRRIDGRVFEWLEASDTSIAAEWLGLVKVQPFSAVGLVTASAVAIVLSVVIASPLVWVTRVFL